MSTVVAYLIQVESKRKEVNLENLPQSSKSEFSIFLMYLMPLVLTISPVKTFITASSLPVTMSVLVDKN